MDSSYTPILFFSRPRQPRRCCRTGRSLPRHTWLSWWVWLVWVCPATAPASSHSTASHPLISSDERDGGDTKFFICIYMYIYLGHLESVFLVTVVYWILTEPDKIFRDTDDRSILPFGSFYSNIQSLSLFMKLNIIISQNINNCKLAHRMFMLLFAVSHYPIQVQHSPKF